MLWDLIRSIKFSPRESVVILDTEHPNHVLGWLSLRSQGLEARQVPTTAEVDRTGQLTAANAATFAPYIDEITKAIGLSSIMFHSGQWNDVKDICDPYRPQRIHVLADLTQQVSFTHVDVQALGVSAAAFSLHRGLNCPTGSGVLYVNQQVLEGLNPEPPMTTFDSLAERRADFTVDVADPILLQNNAQRFDHSNQNPSAVAAAEVHLTFYLDTMGPKTVESYLFSLGDTLRDECKQLRIKIIGPQSRKEHAPHLYILDINGEGWVNFMKENGVQISPYKLGIRVSFVDFITIWTMSRDWPRFCDKVYKAGCVHRLRAALPALSYDRNQNFGP
jgi:selenocysteine lyase/cysteine desulfurase